MTASDFGSLASAAAAFLALVVSIVSLVKTNKFNERQNRLAETTERLNQMLIERGRAEDVTSKKADLSANLVETGKGNYRLRVFNRGKGVARNVRLTDLSDQTTTILIEGDIQHRFPIAILDQQQSVDLIAAICMGSPFHAHIKLQWDDETGTDHEKELTPTL